MRAKELQENWSRQVRGRRRVESIEREAREKKKALAKAKKRSELTDAQREKMRQGAQNRWKAAAAKKEQYAALTEEEKQKRPPKPPKKGASAQELWWYGYNCYVFDCQQHDILPESYGVLSARYPHVFGKEITLNAEKTKK